MELIGNCSCSGTDEDTKAPEIFSLLPGKMNKNGEAENWQAEAFVRWIVEIPGDPTGSLYGMIMTFGGLGSTIT